MAWRVVLGQRASDVSNSRSVVLGYGLLVGARKALPLIAGCQISILRGWSLDMGFFLVHEMHS